MAPNKPLDEFLEQLVLRAKGRSGRIRELARDGKKNNAYLQVRNGVRVNCVALQNACRMEIGIQRSTLGDRLDGIVRLLRDRKSEVSRAVDEALELDVGGRSVADYVRGEARPGGYREPSTEILDSCLDRLERYYEVLDRELDLPESPSPSHAAEDSQSPGRSDDMAEPKIPERKGCASVVASLIGFLIVVSWVVLKL